MLAEIPRTLFLEWLAYHELEPWGPDRADARAAIVAAVTYNVNRGRGARSRGPKDFLAYTPPRRRMGKAKVELFKHMMRGAGADTE